MQRLTRAKAGLTAEEYRLLGALTSPVKIQDFLDTVAMNFEEDGETNRSPRRVLHDRTAHCLEGAVLAAAALWVAGERPLLMNLSSRLGRGDVDHVVALYKKNGAWGAISKTNHATIRFRDPVYRNLHELALSYFHEWFVNETGEKVLECYSTPLDLRRFGTAWLTAPHDLHFIADALGDLEHTYLVPDGNWRHVRNADAMETRAGQLTEWKEGGKRV